MKRFIFFISIISLVCIGCASPKNSWEERRVRRDVHQYVSARNFCKKNSTNYNECMNEQFNCEAKIVQITNRLYATTEEKYDNRQKSKEIFKRNNVYEKYHNQELSSCEVLELYKKEW